jgi:uncharacterized protein (TIGR02145 family)
MKTFGFFLVVFMGSMFNPQTLVSQTKGTVKDPRDGQVYKTVQIGVQWWMAENLNYKTPKSFYYLTDSSFAKTFGRLYIYEDALKACPSGWHLPADAEWTQLAEYLGGDDDAGGVMKDTDSGLWNFLVTGEDNSSGFSALPGGCHSTDWKFGMMRFLGFWWTATPNNNASSWYRYLEAGYTKVFRADAKKMNGFSIRCVKD